MGDDIDPYKVSKFGFAKLLGTRGDEPVEYLIRKFEIILGRNSKNSTADVVLGESMSISRKHAVIRYNFETKCFELIVMGKNVLHPGVKVGDVTVSPDDQPRELHSGDCISTALESSMHFLLPKRSHPFKQSFNGGSGTPVLSDASHPLTHAAAAAADTPTTNTSIGAGAQPMLSNPAGLAAVRVPVGISPLQAGLHATGGVGAESQRTWPIDGDRVEGGVQPDTVMADSPAIASEQPVGFQRLGLPILPGGPALQYGGVGDAGTIGTPHSIAPP